MKKIVLSIILLSGCVLADEGGKEMPVERLEVQEEEHKKISASLNGIKFSPDKDVALTVNVQPFKKQIRIGVSKNF